MTKIHTEIYGEGQPLVMIHGWAMHTGIWREFAQHLARHCQVICLDLPGHGRSETLEPFTLKHIGEALLAAIPVQQFTLLGWSLGATIAMDMADRFPERIRNLIVLAGNPYFVQTEHWPGVKSATLDSFAELLKMDVQQTLMRFLALQVNGLSHGKQLLQILKLAMQECLPPAPAVLQDGLHILKNSDLRQVIIHSRIPVSLILGGRDTLVPVSSGEMLRHLNRGIDVYVLEKAGHAPFLSHAEELLAIICRQL